MNDHPAADLALKKFTEAVENYVPKLADNLQRLVPFRTGIVELRRRGASYGTIVGILRDVGVKVARHSLTRYCVEVLQLPPLRRELRPASRGVRADVSSRRSLKRRGRSADPSLSAADLSSPASSNQGRRLDDPKTPRGPRIADPNNI